MREQKERRDGDLQYRLSEFHQLPTSEKSDERNPVWSTDDDDYDDILLLPLNYLLLFIQHYTVYTLYIIMI